MEMILIIKKTNVPNVTKNYVCVRKNLILSENRRAQNITFKCKDNPNADHSLSTRPMQLCRYNSV